MGEIPDLDVNVDNVGLGPAPCDDKTRFASASLWPAGDFFSCRGRNQAHNQDQAGSGSGSGCHPSALRVPGSAEAPDGLSGQMTRVRAVRKGGIQVLLQSISSWWNTGTEL